MPNIHIYIHTYIVCVCVCVTSNMNDSGSRFVTTFSFRHYRYFCRQHITLTTVLWKRIAKSTKSQGSWSYIWQYHLQILACLKEVIPSQL